MFRSYWNWDRRSRETDRRWLALQCSKEIWGSGLAPLDKGIFLGPAEQLVAAFPRIDIELDRHEVLDIAEGLRAEFAHYCAFADAHDALALPGEPKLNPHAVKTAWKEDLELSALRFAHKKENPKLGRPGDPVHGRRLLHAVFGRHGLKDRTQGPHGRANALIAQACADVYEDEFGHMLKGIVGLDAEGLTGRGLGDAGAHGARAVARPHPHAQRAVRRSACGCGARARARRAAANRSPSTTARPGLAA